MDSLLNDKARMEYIQNRFQRNQNSDATKYWIKKWMMKNDWEDEKITHTLGAKY